MPTQSTATKLETDEELPLRQFLTFNLARVQAKLNAQAAHLLREKAGLSLTQWRILSALGLKGPSTQADLCRFTVTDKGLFSRKLKGMIAANLVTAKQDANDHRRQLIKLSETGQALYEHTLPIMRSRQHFLMACLDDKERKAIFSALQKLEIAAEARRFD